MSVVTVVLGLVLLTAGAELVVRGGSRLATLAGVSPLVVGLTIVAVGTSAPELAIGIDSARQGVGDLALGNIAGTNIVNTLLVLGLIAFLAALPLHPRVPRIDLPVMVGAAALLLVMSLDGHLSVADGVVLLVGGVVYTVGVVRTSRREDPGLGAEFEEMLEGPEQERGPLPRTSAVLGKQVVVVIVGLALIVLGADRLVSGAVSIATSLGVSDAFVGLTVVAIGTSAPELVTAIVASVRGERDIAVGNLFGSSVYNVLIILGLTVVASPGGLDVPSDLLRFDLPVMLAVSILCIPVFLTGHKVSRREGAMFLSLYAVYFVVVLWMELA